VLENASATETGRAWSGDIRDGLDFSHKVQAWVVNPFVTYKGLELFGNIEQAKGSKLGELKDRKFTQTAGEALYRLPGNNFYVAGRYCTVKGKYSTFSATQGDATVNRMQVGGGWFLTQTMLAKLEYVDQQYKDFPLNDIRHDGKFKGVMFEATVCSDAILATQGNAGGMIATGHEAWSHAPVGRAKARPPVPLDAAAVPAQGTGLGHPGPDRPAAQGDAGRG
jgi:hypothetical protein